MEYLHTPIAPLKHPVGAQIKALHETLRRTDDAWRAAFLAKADDSVVRGLVECAITANYAYQKARWGKIVNRLSVSAVLQGGAR